MVVCADLCEIVDQREVPVVAPVIQQALTYDVLTGPARVHQVEPGLVLLIAQYVSDHLHHGRQACTSRQHHQPVLLQAQANTLTPDILNLLFQLTCILYYSITKTS